MIKKTFAVTRFSHVSLNNFFITYDSCAAEYVPWNFNREQHLPQLKQRWATWLSGQCCGKFVPLQIHKYRCVWRLKH